jgi:hypothetical protein
VEHPEYGRWCSLSCKSGGRNSMGHGVEGGREVKFGSRRGIGASSEPGGGGCDNGTRDETIPTTWRSPKRGTSTSCPAFIEKHIGITSAASTTSAIVPQISQRLRTIAKKFDTKYGGLLAPKLLLSCADCSTAIQWCTYGPSITTSHAIICGQQHVRTYTLLWCFRHDPKSNEVT